MTSIDANEDNSTTLIISLSLRLTRACDKEWQVQFPVLQQIVLSSLIPKTNYLNHNLLQWPRTVISTLLPNPTTTMYQTILVVTSYGYGYLAMWLVMSHSILLLKCKESCSIVPLYWMWLHNLMIQNIAECIIVNIL